MAEKRKRDDGTEGALVKRVAATDGAGGGALVTIEQARANQLQVAGVTRTTSLHAPIMQLRGHDASVFASRFAESGDILASASFDHTVRLWRVFGEECENYSVLKVHKAPVLDCVFGAADSLLVSCSADKSVVVTDVESGARLRKWPGHRATVHAVSTHGHNGITASVSDDAHCRLWDPRVSGRNSAGVVVQPYPLTAVALMEGQVVIGGIDNIVRVFDRRQLDSDPLFELVGHDDTISSLTIHPNGSHVLSNSFDCTLREWDVRPFCDSSDRCTNTYMGHNQSADKNLIRASYNADATRVGCGSGDRFVYVWNRASTKIEYKLPGHKGCVNDVQFHPKEHIIASASNDKTIYLGELEES